MGLPARHLTAKFGNRRAAVGRLSRLSITERDLNRLAEEYAKRTHQNTEAVKRELLSRYCHSPRGVRRGTSSSNLSRLRKRFNLS